MYERGKSDGCVVPAKRANNAAQAVAESVEERHPAKENAASKTRPGHRAGQARQVRWLVCVKWHKEISKHGSRRCCTMSASTVCGRRFGRSAQKPRQELTV